MKQKRGFFDKTTFEMYRESLRFIRQNEPPEGYYVGFSGGKDSIVTLNLVKMSGVNFKAYYSCTGIDPPEVVRFIKKEYPEVIFLYPKMTFWEGIRKKSPPLRMQRWCCDVLKKDPAKNIPLKNRIMGLRAEESYRRAARPRINKFGKQTIYKPIFDWKEYHIWEFIEEYKLAYPCLYDEGFDRIGCVICPFLPYKNMRRINVHRAKWPKMYKLFEKVVTEWWVQNRGRNLEYAKKYKDKTPGEYLLNWYKGGFPKEKEEN